MGKKTSALYWRRRCPSTTVLSPKMFASMEQQKPPKSSDHPECRGVDRVCRRRASWSSLSRCASLQRPIASSSSSPAPNVITAQSDSYSVRKSIVQLALPNGSDIRIFIWLPSHCRRRQWWRHAMQQQYPAVQRNMSDAFYGRVKDLL